MLDVKHDGAADAEDDEVGGERRCAVGIQGGVVFRNELTNTLRYTINPLFLRRSMVDLVMLINRISTDSNIFHALMM